MMVKRVAALYDIHGNLPALEAVLEELRHEKLDHVVVGGDVLPGPMVIETLEYLKKLHWPTEFIYGNCEVAVLEARAGRDPGRMPEQSKQAMRWMAQQLSDEHECMLRKWPKAVTLQIEGLGEVLFCHATPRNENEIFTRLTPETAVLPALAGVTAKTVICGHTHMPFERMIGGIRVVNAGSVGMPFGKTGADWLLLGPGIELRHTSYDLSLAAKRVREQEYPQAEEFAAKYVLAPPSEEEMLELFKRAEMK